MRRWPNVGLMLGQRLMLAWIGPVPTPVAGTGLGHRLTPYKIVVHFFVRSYLSLPPDNQVKIFFLQTVTFQLHTRMLSSQVAQSLKSYGHFFSLGSRPLSVIANPMGGFSGKANKSIHGLVEDDTASPVHDIYTLILYRPLYKNTPDKNN